MLGWPLLEELVEGKVDAVLDSAHNYRFLPQGRERASFGITGTIWETRSLTMSSSILPGANTPRNHRELWVDDANGGRDPCSKAIGHLVGNPLTFGVPLSRGGEDGSRVDVVGISAGEFTQSFASRSMSGFAAGARRMQSRQPPTRRCRMRTRPGAFLQPEGK